WGGSLRRFRSNVDLAWKCARFHSGHMTQKKLVLDVINELPDEASLAEIAERIDFLAAIQKGIDQIDQGEGIPHDEVKRQLATWLAS
ncbi:MAG: hypothetical protein M3429_04495, partial [Verrucomicrobiota bacterium]|nr:hypothetical protein [Verrucomicrobiota bacterium]